MDNNPLENDKNMNEFGEGSPGAAEGVGFDAKAQQEKFIGGASDAGKTAEKTVSAPVEKKPGRIYEIVRKIAKNLRAPGQPV